eukprot:Lithocolla_globosa_v1_NODE_1678_length_2402_cov_33.350660.p2 type:complete len:251 gc:universal NODE_1678_length_2402_cov_33.350660:1555-2307(+)
METVEYWKAKAEHYKKNLDELQKEFEEFQEDSRTLEQELESELERATATAKTLQPKHHRLIVEHDDLKTKYQEHRLQYNSETLKLEGEISELEDQKNSFLVQIRELEQLNDDLQRSERATKSSCQELQIKYNQLLENQTLLEQELEEKQEKEIELQRLKDLVRDMENELMVLRTVKRRKLEEDSLVGDSANDPSPTPKSELSDISVRPNFTGTPSQLVQEMQTYVKSLEERISSCRNIVSPMLTDGLKRK